MTLETMQEHAWELLSCACKVCKLLLWLRDVDSVQRLAPQLREPLKEALHTIARFPSALDALRDKMGSIYEVALTKPLVGIASSPFSGRLGKRTAELGLLAALDFARERQEDFKNQARRVCGSGNADWEQLFGLAGKFIDYLDWGEFVLENTRGQAACLVLECVELLETVSERSQGNVEEELGDVFYNFMALCLSLRIEARHVC